MPNITCSGNATQGDRLDMGLSTARTKRFLVQRVRYQAQRDALDRIAGHQVDNHHTTPALRRVWQTAFNQEIKEQLDVSTGQQRIRLEAIFSTLPNPQIWSQRAGVEAVAGANEVECDLPQDDPGRA